VNRQIQNSVAHFDNLDLSQDEIEVISTQELGDHAVAQVKIKTAVKLTKQNGQWVIDEIRIGDRRWEKADHIRAILRSERTQTTRKQLQLLKDGVQLWAERHGSLPQAADFGALMAMLTPGYVPEVLATDAWSHPYIYRRLSPNTAEVRSPGPDGLPGTPDDLSERVEK